MPLTRELDTELRKRCQATLHKLQLAQLLRQGDPVDVLYEFMSEEIIPLKKSIEGLKRTIEDARAAILKATTPCP
jgi:hypothetical protein